MKVDMNLIEKAQALVMTENEVASRGVDALWRWKQGKACCLAHWPYKLTVEEILRHLHVSSQGRIHFDFAWEGRKAGYIELLKSGKVSR